MGGLNCVNLTASLPVTNTLTQTLSLTHTHTHTHTHTQVVLGPVGRNVAAGMTGGLGFFLDEEGDFCGKVCVRVLVCLLACVLMYHRWFVSLCLCV
jgi:hypothetical protein